MSDDETLRATAICPGCGGKNEFIAGHLSTWFLISCSHCGAELGRLGEFVPGPKAQVDDETIALRRSDKSK